MYRMRTGVWIGVTATIVAPIALIATLSVADRSAAPSSPVREQPRDATAGKIVDSALSQVGTTYFPGYVAMDYPNGDLPTDKGACTDVVIRALRAAGQDLQELMHKDMSAHFSLYPTRYGHSKPDPNIDHRRVPNQLVFMRRFAQSLTTEVSSPEPWQAGDIVYWKMSEKLDHCGIVSNLRNDRGLPLVIHNASSCVEEDALTRWKIVGHFRFPKRD